MSATMRADAIANDNGHGQNMARAQVCEDCGGTGEIHMLGEIYFCPSCRGDDFENQCMERGIDPGMK